MAATRWGIASCGIISQDFATSLTATPFSENHKVVACAARSLKSAQEFANRFGIPRAYAGYEALAEDPEVDVVYVGSINPAHLSMCKILINAGKHVLCEKPLGMNVKETKEIIELARAKKVFLMEAMWARLQPAQLQLKEELDKGTIGDIKQSIVTMGFLLEAGRVNQKELGGGTIIDLGVYTVYYSQLVMGREKPEKIVATGHLNKDGVDVSVSATLMYKGGKTATIVTSSRLTLKNEAEVFGSKGSMILKSPFWSSLELETPEKTHKFDLPDTKLPFNLLNSGQLAHEAQHVRECLQKGLTESPKLTHAETILVAEIMEEIRKQVGVHYPQDDD